MKTFVYVLVGMLALGAGNAFAANTGNYHYSPGGKYVSQDTNVTTGGVISFNSSTRSVWNRYLAALRQRAAAEGNTAPCGSYLRAPAYCRGGTTAYNPFLHGFNR